MFVISRNTAFTCRNKLIDTKQIGRELGVQYVLEGSVRRSADEIRINVQIIDAETDAHLWAERFNYDVANLFTLQDEITSRIAVALDLELVDVEAARPIEHPDARDYILRGRAARLKPPSRESRAEAIALFEQALALDPQSVEAQSWLAIALMARVLDNMAGSAAANISRAENVAEQALVASPRSWLAHFAKGQVFRAQDRYEEAALEYETVIALNRNWADAYSHVGWCKSMTGSLEALIPAQEKACNASTLHAIVLTFLASAYALEGRTERAAVVLAEACKLSRDGRCSSIARLKADGISWGSSGYWGTPTIRTLFEATYFAGLRKAGMPEE
jgi:tetratricopeptide (TPR) repeat protein